ncbi:hypothetical protein F4558_000664 [Micromonospora profundi]|nr:hypothetical protein [Micromonospora profundi]
MTRGCGTWMTARSPTAAAVSADSKREPSPASSAATRARHLADHLAGGRRTSVDGGQSAAGDAWSRMMVDETASQDA